jgi:putative transposase
MCRRFGISRSGYYDFLKRQSPIRACRDMWLSVKIRSIFNARKGRYGSPRIHWELRENGERVSRKRVIRLMQSQNLCARSPKKFKRTTDSSHNLPVAENIVARNFKPAAPNQIWATDISYVRTMEVWVYLAVVIDLYSRRVVGWAVANHMRTELALDALNMALRSREIEPGLIHHSDRGSQYASHDYQNILKQHGAISSMSRKGNCWDNAVAESFFATIKNELIDRHNWLNQSLVEAAIDDYISQFYNQVRYHSAIGNMSPVKFELVSTRNLCL